MKQQVGRIPGLWHIEYQYSIGAMASAFFDRLKEGKIVGVCCESCDRVFVPPKGFCEYCFRPVEHLVELDGRGEIMAVSVVTTPFPGSPDVPYCVAYVRLDGATSSIANFVRGVDLGDGSAMPDSIRVGASVNVVFAQQPAGRITDFWFEPTPTQRHP